MFINEAEHAVVATCTDDTAVEATSVRCCAGGEGADQDEALRRLRKAVTRQPLHREILYQTLVEARTRRTLAQLEHFISDLPQFPSAVQTPYHLVQFLVKAGGLEELEIDAEGCVVTEADKEGLDEDQIDDLVDTWAYDTTSLGCQLIEEMRPQARLEALMSEFAGWDEPLLATIDLLRTKRKLSELDVFLRGLTPNGEADGRLQPSAFVDRLEKAGAIRWEGGWIATEEGIDYVESRRF